jgi:hypothetical protein
MITYRTATGHLICPSICDCHSENNWHSLYVDCSGTSQKRATYSFSAPARRPRPPDLVSCRQPVTHDRCRTRLKVCAIHTASVQDVLSVCHAVDAPCPTPLISPWLLHVILVISSNYQNTDGLQASCPDVRHPPEQKVCSYQHLSSPFARRLSSFFCVVVPFVVHPLTIFQLIQLQTHSLSNQQCVLPL